MSKPLHAVGPPPHLKLGASIKGTNLMFIICLIPAVAASLAVFGPRAGGLMALAAGFAWVVEYLCQLLMKQQVRVGDGHAILCGLLLALLCPPRRAVVGAPRGGLHVHPGG